ncbi:MAG: hypothetical protein IJC73_06410 [Lentisphaeria bacterium]|nr:hypothetical protein [Lentisphaeria bacterium]
MKNHRRHIGPAFTSYPAKRVGDSIGNFCFKVIMTILCCLGWTLVHYALVGVVNFCRTHFQEHAIPMTNAECFKTDFSIGVLLFSYLVILYIVMKSKIGRRSEVKTVRSHVSRKNRGGR